MFPWCKDSPQIVMLWWEWLENKLVVGEKFVFYEAYEEVGVARSHFGSHSNTVDLFVVVVTKRKTVECENQFS